MRDEPLEIQAEFEAGRRCRAGGLGQIVLLAVFVYSTPLRTAFPEITWPLVALIFFLNLARFHLGQQQGLYYPRHRRLWNDLLAISLIGPAVAWGSLFYLTLQQHGLGSYPTTIAFLIGSGIAAGMTTSLSSKPRIGRAVMLIVIGFPLAQLLQRMEPDSLALAVICITFILFLNAQLKIQAQTYRGYQRSRTNAVEERDRLHTVLDAIPGLVSWIGSDLRYLGVNGNFSQFFGARPGDPVGKVSGACGDDAPFFDNVRGFMASSETHRAMEFLLCSSGFRRWHLAVMQKSSMHPINGKAVEAYLICIDIHDLKMAEDELERRRIEVELASKLATIGEFTAGIAHELKNPLTAVLNASQLLQKSLEAPEISRPNLNLLADRIRMASTRIDKIVAGLNRFSRTSEKEPWVTVGIEDIVRESVELIGPQFHSSRVTLKVDQMDPSVRVECKPTEISQVLINLLSNALDAAKKSPERWVQLNAGLSAGQVTLFVSDSGAGIPPETRRKLFQPFFTTKPSGQGTGLGLSISRKIVERHGGRLELEVSARHTTFVVWLPAAVAEEHDRAV